MRLPGWDYSSPGGYFVTLCTHRRACLFGEVINDAMRLNAYGEIAAMCWEEIPEHFKMAGIDEFVIMPHHVHGMVFLEADLESDAGAQHALSLQDPPDEEKALFGRILPKSLSSIIRSCKSAVTRNINQPRGTPGTRVWQRGYDDHILRDDADLDAARRCILDNPPAHGR